VALARGPYFKWAAADDLCEPEHVARSVEVLEADPTVVLAYPKARFIDEQGNRLALSDPGWDLRSDLPHERLRRVLLRETWVNVLFGVVRREALSRVRPMPSYAGGDYALLAELCLLGKIVEIPDPLFLRRIHPGSSSQNLSRPDWMTYFHTGKTRENALPLWHLLGDQLRTTLRARIGSWRKLVLLSVLLRRTAGRGGRLTRELVGALLAAIVPRRAPRPPVDPSLQLPRSVGPNA
jgi:hypothetical protein